MLDQGAEGLINRRLWMWIKWSHHVAVLHFGSQQLSLEVQKHIFFCWFNKNLHDHDVNVCRASADVKPKKLKYSQSVLTTTLIGSLDHCSPLFYDRLIAARL